MSNTEVHLSERVEQLEQIVLRQQQMLARLDTSRPSTAGDDEAQPSPPSSRRAMLRGGVAAVGAGLAGAALIGRPAAAADGDNMKVGEQNDSSSKTELRMGAGGDVNANILTVQDWTWPGSDFPSAIGGYATRGRVDNGVFGYSRIDPPATLPTSGGYGVVAFASDRGQRSRAPLLLVPNGGSPEADSISHARGEVVADSSGKLWFCTETGTPGTWAELTSSPGPTFFATSERAFDSRPGQAGDGAAKGAFTAGETRVVDLTVDTTFPAGASAAIINLAVVATTGAPGFASVYSADSPDLAPPTFSNINWFGLAQNLANTTTTAASSTGSIKVYASEATHIAIDVIAYYA